MPRNPAPGLTLAWGMIPSGSMPIEIGRRSGQSHRPGVRPRYAFDRVGTVGGRVKSHCSRNGVCLQCHLMAKAQPKTRDFDWKRAVETDCVGVNLMCRNPNVAAIVGSSLPSTDRDTADIPGDTDGQPTYHLRRSVTSELADSVAMMGHERGLWPAAHSAINPLSIRRIRVRSAMRSSIKPSLCSARIRAAARV